MPIIGSLASLSKNGFSASSVATSITVWLSATFLKANFDQTILSGRKYNNQIWVYGRNGSAVAPGYRSFAIQLNATTGLPSSYLVFANSTSQYVVGLAVDTSGNKNIQFVGGGGRLAKYDTSNTLVIAREFLGIGSSVANTLCMDNSNDLYWLTNSSATLSTVNKLTSSTYTVAWSKELSFSTNDRFLFMDNAGNTYFVSYTTTGTVTTIIKLDTSGNIVWQKSSSNMGTERPFLAFDSSNNVYIMTSASPDVRIAKLDSSGTLLWSYNITGGGTFRAITINTDGNIVISSDNIGGSFIDVRTTILDSNGTVLYYTKFANSTSDYQQSCVSLISMAGATYVIGTLSDNNTWPHNFNVKVTNYNNVIYSTPYSYTLTKDNATTQTFSSTLSTQALTLPTRTSITVTFTNTAYTTTNSGISTSSTTFALGATVPFSYSTPLI